MEPIGRQWFSLRRVSRKARLAGAQKAAPILDAFIDSEMARHRLGEERIALLGFSQGAMMALHVGLRRARAVAAIVSYSGLVVGEDLLREEMRSSPPVLLTHGTADQILPFACLAHAEANLKALGLSVEAYPRLGLPHAIDEECIRQGRRFLAEAFESAASDVRGRSPESGSPSPG
jgi:phospholipase/carboxylesterase